MDAGALERALSSFDVRPRRTERVRLGVGASLELPRGAASLVYVRGGEITGGDASGRSCALDAVTGRAAWAPGARTLLAGDLLLSLGASRASLVSWSGAEVVVAELELSFDAASGRLPAMVLVTDLAATEPAAAALAAHLGPPESGADGGRSGDGVICRMMISTVVLSALRAWASGGCGVPEWPARLTDPFLARVVEAIADDPGRAWTIDELAGLSAMSRSVFSERFRRAVGRSPADHIAEVRMRRAKEMLEAGSTVAETSRALGYASDDGFSRAFRRRTGSAPSNWCIGAGGTSRTPC